jgi:hypothetical protein
LDLDPERQTAPYAGAPRREPPRLVYNIILSMPPGIDPMRLLLAAQDFAMDEFALAHRYAMVLHTDEPHPHVHLVVKEMSEQGRRLRIDKAKLRSWRERFAMQLRARGVEANATSRTIRGA